MHAQKPATAQPALGARRHSSRRPSGSWTFCECAPRAPARRGYQLDCWLEQLVDVCPAFRWIIMPVPVLFPGNTCEYVAFRRAPSDNGIVRGAERLVRSPMCGRGYVAPRNFRVLDAADRRKGASYADAELDIDDVAWFRVIYEYILSVEGDRTAPRSSVDLIEQRSEARRDLTEGHALANRCERVRCDALNRNRIRHEQPSSSVVRSGASFNAPRVGRELRVPVPFVIPICLHSRTPLITTPSPGVKHAHAETEPLPVTELVKLARREDRRSLLQPSETTATVRDARVNSGDCASRGCQAVGERDTRGPPVRLDARSDANPLSATITSTRPTPAVKRARDIDGIKKPWKQGRFVTCWGNERNGTRWCDQYSPYLYQRTLVGNLAGRITSSSH